MKQLSAYQKQSALLLLIPSLLFGALGVMRTQSYLAARNATLSTISQHGDSSNEVLQIQKRLHDWGYLKAEPTGYYGPKTEEAVRFFQRKHGIPQTGVCGPLTLEALGLPVNGGSASSGVSSNGDYHLLARIISAEARGESYTGQVAVGACVLNRVEHPSFPDTVAGVIYQPGAFSAINDGQFDQPIAESAYRAAREALNGSDPSGGALYYYNPDKTSNQWIRSRPVIKRIGRHLFCK